MAFHYRAGEDRVTCLSLSPSSEIDVRYPLQIDTREVSPNTFAMHGHTMPQTYPPGREGFPSEVSNGRLSPGHPGIPGLSARLLQPPPLLRRPIDYVTPSGMNRTPSLQHVVGTQSVKSGRSLWGTGSTGHFIEPVSALSQDHPNMRDQHIPVPMDSNLYSGRTLNTRSLDGTSRLKSLRVPLDTAKQSLGEQEGTNVSLDTVESLWSPRMVQNTGHLEQLPDGTQNARSPYGWPRPPAAEPRMVSCQENLGTIPTRNLPIYSGDMMSSIPTRSESVGQTIWSKPVTTRANGPGSPVSTAQLSLASRSEPVWATSCSTTRISRPSLPVSVPLPGMSGHNPDVAKFGQGRYQNHESCVYVERSTRSRAGNPVPMYQYDIEAPHQGRNQQLHSMSAPMPQSHYPERKVASHHHYEWRRVEPELGYMREVASYSRPLSGDPGESFIDQYPSHQRQSEREQPYMGNLLKVVEEPSLDRRFREIPECVTNLEINQTGNRSLRLGPIRAVPTGEATGGTLDTSDIPGTGYDRRPEVPHGNSHGGASIPSGYQNISAERGMRSGGKEKRPTLYDGKSSCRDYLVQFDIISELNGWDNTTQAMELATSLSGMACSVLSDIDPGDHRDYDRLVSALLTRFEPENQSEVFRSQLKGYTRKHSEPLTELCQTIKKLIRKAYPNAPSETRDQFATDVFVDALNEGEMEWFVRQGKPSSLDKALQLALEFEAFQLGRQRRHGSKSIVRSQNEFVEPNPGCSRELANYSAIVDDIIGRMAQLFANPPTQSVPPQRERSCYECGAVGHLRPDCPNRKQRPGRSQLRCEHCGIPGHVIADCRKKKAQASSQNVEALQLGAEATQW